MKIAFVIASLQRGGAERVATLLANAWAARGHAVSVVTLEAKGTTPAYALAAAVDMRQLGLASASTSALGGVANNVARIRSLRRHLRDISPDVVVSFLTETNVLAIAAGRGAPWPTVVSERIHPAHHPVARSWILLRRLAYPRAAGIVVQGKDIAAWMTSNLGVEVAIIPNPVDTSEFFPQASRDRQSWLRRRLLAVGRLSRQKGFDILIEGFAAAASDILDWDLVIYGDGPEESALRKLIAERHLEDRVSINHSIADVAEAYRSADAFVHPARYEGYPNVIVEALASGLPVIASNSQDVVRALLADGNYGVLYDTENSQALARALIATLRDRDRCQALAKAAPEAVLANSLDVISARWIALFEARIAGRART